MAFSSGARRVAGFQIDAVRGGCSPGSGKPLFYGAAEAFSTSDRRDPTIRETLFASDVLVMPASRVQCLCQCFSVLSVDLRRAGLTSEFPQLG